jgi:RNA polymerase sigma factor (sigma-70 family)
VFGVEERFDVPRSPAVLMKWAPSRRWERHAVIRNKPGVSATSVTVLMTEYLVSIAKYRDKDAFSKLFAHYAPRLKSYLMRQGANLASAEELSQEAMLSVWRKADRFDPTKASAGTWIFTVARNLRIDALRKERRPNFDPEDPAFVPEPEMSPDRALEVGEVQAKIKAAIAKLPLEQAEVIKLSFYQDKPHGEIAEELNLPLGTVKSRLRLAMRRVRTSLGEDK